MRKLNVIIIDEEIPFPLNTGKRLRTYNLIKSLAAHHHVYFICQKHDRAEENDPDALKRINVTPIVVDSMVRPKKGIKFYLSLFLNLFSKYPYSVTSHYSKKIENKIEEITSAREIDLIHCEWTPYAINMRGFFNYPTIVDAHNVEALIWKRNYEVEKNLLKKFYIFFQWKKMEMFEKKYFQLFDHIATVSEQDKKIISNWIPSNKVSVIDNGVDVNFFIKKQALSENKTIVFTGSMDWRPNIDGIYYFVDSIWPVVQRKCPDSKFYVVGKNPPDGLRNHVKDQPNIIITGTVDDVRPFIDKASVYVVPLRVGGGSRLKILEALSMEKAIVSTTIGAEGLELEDNVDLLIADSPDLFAEKILGLFEDDGLRKRLGETGKNKIYKKYQWAAIAKKLNLLWDRIATTHE